MFRYHSLVFDDLKADTSDCLIQYSFIYSSNNPPKFSNFSVLSMSGLEFRRCYFLAATRNYAPKKRIVLGNIVAGPNTPHQPYNLSPFTIDPKDIDIHNELKWQNESGKTGEVKLGIWASFMQMIVGLGGDAAIGYSYDNTHTLNCDTTTEEFDPSPAFIGECVKDPGIQEFLNKNKKKIIKGHLPVHIYMITGIKIAKNASLVSKMTKNQNVHLHLGIDGTPAAIPISGGPDIDVNRGDSSKESFGKADTFVLGFRLHQIKISPKGGIKTKQYLDGAALGTYNNNDEELEKIELEFSGLEPDNAHGEDFEIGTTFLVMDENSGEQCEIVNTLNRDQ